MLYSLDTWKIICVKYSNETGSELSIITTASTIWCHISFNIFHIPVLIYHRDDSFHLGLISVIVDNQKLFTISRFWDCKGFWEMRLYVKRKPCGAETEILQDNYVNTMAADVPVPCAANHQRHWYLTKQGEVIFHVEKNQLPVPPHFRGWLECKHIYFSLYEFSRQFDLRGALVQFKL